MIRLLFVGDGERDSVTNPPLVAGIVGADIDTTPIPWPRLHQAGKGYDRKFLFALRQARANEFQGVVGTVDRDKSHGRDRLRELTAARGKDRQTAPPLPTAVAMADPHAEAWLLDDPIAVRTGLRLPANTDIPSVRRTSSPKDALTDLHAHSPRSDDPVLSVLADIAKAVIPSRCQHNNETGFASFVEDVRHEIGPLAPTR